MNAIDTISLKSDFTPKSQKQSRLTVWTLIWAGFWTGVLLCGFVMLMR